MLTVAMIDCSPKLNWRGYRRDEAPCQVLGLILTVNSALDDDELVAAKPGHKIVGAGNRAEALGERS